MPDLHENVRSKREPPTAPCRTCWLWRCGFVLSLGALALSWWLGR
jgi:hypothetical protein